MAGPTRRLSCADLRLLQLSNPDKDPSGRAQKHRQPRQGVPFPCARHQQHQRPDRAKPEPDKPVGRAAGSKRAMGEEVGNRTDDLLTTSQQARLTRLHSSPLTCGYALNERCYDGLEHCSNCNQTAPHGTRRTRSCCCCGCSGVAPTPASHRRGGSVAGRSSGIGAGSMLATARPDNPSARCQGVSAMMWGVEYVSRVPRPPLNGLIHDLYYLEGAPPYSRLMLPAAPAPLLIVNRGALPHPRRHPLRGGGIRRRLRRHHTHSRLGVQLPTPDPVRRRALQAVGAGPVPTDARGRGARPAGDGGADSGARRRLMSCETG